MIRLLAVSKRVWIFLGVVVVWLGANPQILQVIPAKYQVVAVAALGLLTKLIDASKTVPS